MKVHLIISILCSVLGFTFPSFSLEQPLETGLPEVLPPDFAYREMMVDFFQAPNTFRAPLAAGISFNNKPIPMNDYMSLGMVFEEFFFAKLPKGNFIKASANGEGLKVWDYPAGSMIVHIILLKTQPRQYFEVRLEQKNRTGQWAFGLYTPGNQGLHLNHYTGLRNESFSVKLASGQLMNIELKHIGLQSCRMCHFMNSPSKYQYPAPELAGPCGFGPANSGLVTDWAPRYFKIHGENPILAEVK
jgi:hypothetical protein